MSAPAPRRARPHLTDGWLRSHRDLIVTLGPNEGFLSWKSSPHVMWLASVLAPGVAA